jgi:hypothetical protein
MQDNWDQLLLQTTTIIIFIFFWAVEEGIKYCQDYVSVWLTTKIAMVEHEWVNEECLTRRQSCAV